MLYEEWQILGYMRGTRKTSDISLYKKECPTDVVRGVADVGLYERYKKDLRYEFLSRLIQLT